MFVPCWGSCAGSSVVYRGVGPWKPPRGSQPDAELSVADGKLANCGVNEARGEGSRHHLTLISKWGDLAPLKVAL